MSIRELTDALKRALLAAKSVAIPTAPANILTEMFTRLGIPNELRNKARKILLPAREIVTRGDAALGCQQTTELKLSKTALR